MSRNLAGFLVDPTSFIKQAACVIYSRGQAGSETANQVYRLSSVRNDLDITEFFEPIFAEFNANP
jgi:hypothetical protein